MTELGPPYTDIRIERPRALGWNSLATLPGLVTIHLHPPASGPEIELVFGTQRDLEPADIELLKGEVERLTGRPVLAARRRV